MAQGVIHLERNTALVPLNAADNGSRGTANTAIIRTQPPASTEATPTAVSEQYRPWSVQTERTNTCIEEVECIGKYMVQQQWRSSTWREIANGRLSSCDFFVCVFSGNPEIAPSAL